MQQKATVCRNCSFPLISAVFQWPFGCSFLLSITTSMNVGTWRGSDSMAAVNVQLGKAVLENWTARKLPRFLIICVFFLLNWVGMFCNPVLFSGPRQLPTVLSHRGNSLRNIWVSQRRNNLWYPWCLNPSVAATSLPLCKSSMLLMTDSYLQNKYFN